MNPYAQRERMIQYAREIFGTEPEYLWERTPDAAVFRHTNSRKWYAIIMRVARDRLGLEGDEPIDVMNIKCDPLLLGSLLLEKGFLPAYHMSKTSWISIRLDGSVPDGKIIPLLEMSYESVTPKRKRNGSKQIPKDT